MLRMILSVTGVGLIVLGLFGGRPLDDLYRNISRGTPTLVDAEVLASNEVLVGSAASSSETTLKPIPDNATSSQSAAVTEKQLQHAVASEQSSVTGDAAAVVQLAADTATPETPAAVMKVTSAKPEQQKANDRNAQVEMATTILAASGKAGSQTGKPIVVTGESEGKQAELAEALANTAGQLKTDMLVVIKDKVNMRDGPSIDHSVVLELALGQELMEFKREGRWVHVGAYGTSGKIGWVHQRLVGAGAVSAN